MIPFFRQIRHQLVSPKKGSKYLIYAGVDWSLNTVDVSWAGEVQKRQLKDSNHLFKLLNMVSQRSRTSSVHLDLMSRMTGRITAIKTDINSYFNHD